MVQLIDILGGIQRCIAIFGKWIFKRNVPFSLPLNIEDLEGCSADKYQQKVINGDKESWKAIGFIPIYKNKLFGR